MSFPVRAVIFDWAGTMVDFGCMAPVRALTQVFAEEGVVVSAEEARRDMGRAKLDHLRALLADPLVAARWAALKGAAASEGERCRRAGVAAGSARDAGRTGCVHVWRHRRERRRCRVRAANARPPQHPECLTHSKTDRDEKDRGE